LWEHLILLFWLYKMAGMRVSVRQACGGGTRRILSSANQPYRPWSDPRPLAVAPVDLWRVANPQPHPWLRDRE
jgi:hypothetical protein